jgi:glycerol kinase
MTEPLILAIDQGTSSTKCLLVGADGEIVARASSPLGIAYPQPGWVEQSADEIWASVTDSVAKCLVGQDARRVVAVGVSNQRESALLWERATGQPVGPVLGWQDQRTVDRGARLRAEGAAAWVRQVSGLPLDPMFSALKAGWLLDRYDPDRSRSARGELCLGTVDSWLVARLLGNATSTSGGATGRRGTAHRIETGNAARTQLLDVRKQAWSLELLELFGVPPEILPEIVTSDREGEIHGLPGVPPGTRLGAVLGDSHAALFAHGAFTPGMVKATYGTGSSVMGLVDSTADLDDGVCLTIAWDTGEPAYAAEGNIRASGAILVWLAGVLGSTPEDLLAMAATASSDGVVLVPAFGGLGAPWWDDGAVATLAGLTLGTGPRQLARAAAEAITLQVTDVVQAIAGADRRADCLLVDGGASASDTLMQLQADITGIPVHRAGAPDLSALGAAHLAGLSAAVWTPEQLGALARRRDTFHPAPADPRTGTTIAAWRTALARARYRP